MKLVKEKIILPTVYTVPAVSIKNRDKLIAKSKAWESVTSVGAQANVAEYATDLRRLVKDAKAVCAPILKAIKTAGDAVRKIQNDYIAPVEAEQERCERMLVDFHEREAKRVAEETAAREAELKQLQAPVDTNGDIAMQELVTYQNEQAAEELMRLPAPEPVKPKGVSIQQRMRVEVTDIHALYAARPDLVRLEANLSAIQAGCVPEIQIPGLRTWWETTAETRAA